MVTHPNDIPTPGIEDDTACVSARDRRIRGKVSVDGDRISFEERTLSNFFADGALPISRIDDKSLFVAATYQVVKKSLEVYGTASRVFDDFGINPYEVAGGANYYPSGTRSWRVNLHLIRVVHSMAGGYFGFYTPGLDGTILSVGTDFLF